ncbi:MAG TPA: RDD family protein [Steroidobacteraceae bacterium]
MSWYVRRGEREIGPVGEDALRALVGTGQISADTQLWREGLSAWTEAIALPGVLGPRATAPFAASLRPPLVTAAPDAPRSMTFAPAGTALQANTALPAGATLPADTALPAGVTLAEPASPWRRYWARSLDITISTFVVAVLIGALRPGLSAQVGAAKHAGWIIVLILLPFALAMDALIHWALGNTPGKAIGGVKVLTQDGRRPLSAAAYLGRNFGVYAFGLGLGLPLVSLITLIASYRRAAAGDISRWDRLSGSRVYVLSGSELRTWAVASIYVLGVTALLALGLYTRHDRSAYTVAHTPAPVLQQELTQAANGVNANSPHMVDRITRLDGAHVGPGALFTYEYTLTNMHAARLSAMTLETLRWRLSAHVRQAVCRSTALRPMLSTGTVIRFRYRDKDGQELATVTVSRADCGG